MNSLSLPDGWLLYRITQLHKIRYNEAVDREARNSALGDYWVTFISVAGPETLSGRGSTVEAAWAKAVNQADARAKALTPPPVGI